MLSLVIPDADVHPRISVLSGSRTLYQGALYNGCGLLSILIANPEDTLMVMVYTPDRKFKFSCVIDSTDPRNFTVKHFTNGKPEHACDRQTLVTYLLGVYRKL